MTTDKKGLFTSADGKNLAFTFTLVSSLFLLWGICNGLIDTMDKHFQNELGLSKAQSANVQFAHYLGYFLMSLPAGVLASKLGWKGGIIAGLLIVAIGGFWFIPASHIQAASQLGHVSATTAFVAYLCGVCAIATGLTFLETVANPYTTVLGPPEYAATRINLAQSANGIGWLVSPIIGSIFFYSKDAQGQSTGSQTLYIPYATIAVIVVILAVIFYFAYVPDIKNEDDYQLDESKHGLRSIWSHKHFVLAIVAQFFYVAAQAGIFSFFINSMTSDRKTGFTMVPAIPASWDSTMTALAGHAPFDFLHNWLLGWFETNQAGMLCISDKGAANLATVAFACFLLGRLVGSWLMKKFPAHKILGIFALGNVMVTLLIFCNLGWLSVICVFVSYFFMSIMFPTIFALGIFGLGALTKKASSFIVMAIMGGAILPKLMGYIADQYDMCRSFIVPMLCFAFIMVYAFLWPRFSNVKSLPGASTTGAH